MRRLLSIALMVVVGMPLFASLVGIGQKANVPICCRRSGAHQCMEMAVVPATETVVRAVCPVYPRGLAAVQAGVWSVQSTRVAVAELVARPAVLGQVEAGYRISFGRARQKRGPPSNS